MAHKFNGEPVEITETIVLTAFEVTLIRSALQSTGERHEDPSLYNFFDKLEDEMIARKEAQ